MKDKLKDKLITGKRKKYLINQNAYLRCSMCGVGRSGLIMGMCPKCYKKFYGDSL